MPSEHGSASQNTEKTRESCSVGFCGMFSIAAGTFVQREPCGTSEIDPPKQPRPIREWMQAFDLAALHGEA